MSEPVGKPKRGCVFYGCLTLLILSVVGGLTAYFGIRYALKTFVSRYTEEKPSSLPKRLEKSPGPPQPRQLFLSNADLAYHWHLLDREVYLSLWIIIFGLLGFYLLGKIK